MSAASGSGPRAPGCGLPRTPARCAGAIGLLVAASLLPAGAARGDGERPAAGSEQLFSDANSAFLSGDLPRAAAAWQALIDEGVASPELETNLGTALLRAGKRGLAALHFERALFLDSGDDDARADLAELRRNNVDRLEGEEDGGGETLYRFLAPLPGGPAAIALVACWALAWLLLGARLLRPEAAARLSLGAAAGIAFGLAALSGAVTAGAAAGHRIALRRAVIVAPAVPAREGPQPKAHSPFEVHEGTLVRIDDAEGGFRRIKLQNGLAGWVPAEAVELVVPPQWGGLALR